MTYETYEELKQRITERARQLWEEDGRPEGRMGHGRARSSVSAPSARPHPK